jgi:hypothetical protein
VRVTGVGVKVFVALGKSLLLRGWRRPPSHFVLRNLVVSGYVLFYDLSLQKNMGKVSE